MTKYRIIQVKPLNHPYAYSVQYYGLVRLNIEGWCDFADFNSYYEAEQYILARKLVDKTKELEELDNWNATHGKYQVLREYD